MAVLPPNEAAVVAVVAAGVAVGVSIDEVVGAVAVSSVREVGVWADETVRHCTHAH
jgi:hypothetical protein